MKKSKLTEEQIAFALQEAEHGTKVVEVCRLSLEEEIRRYGPWRAQTPEAVVRRKP